MHGRRGRSEILERSTGRFSTLFTREQRKNGSFRCGNSSAIGSVFQWNKRDHKRLVPISKVQAVLPRLMLRDQLSVSTTVSSYNCQFRRFLHCQFLHLSDSVASSHTGRLNQGCRANDRYSDEQLQREAAIKTWVPNPSGRPP
jgi:hypothetical protein